MGFEVGSWVKWSDACGLRLGYSLSDVGRVVGVHDDPQQDGEIDVAFDKGGVLYGAVSHWFEPATVEQSRPNGANDCGASPGAQAGAGPAAIAA